MKLVADRKQNFELLRIKLSEFAAKNNETLWVLKANPISMALSLNTLASIDNITELGSMLYTRGVSGVRVISVSENPTIIDEYHFQGCELY